MCCKGREYELLVILHVRKTILIFCALEQRAVMESCAVGLMN